MPLSTQKVRRLSNTHLQELFAWPENGMPTPEHIERGLLDENAAIREVFVTFETYTLLPEQARRALADEDINVRLALIRRKDYTPTAEQIERGLAVLLNYSVSSMRYARTS